MHLLSKNGLLIIGCMALLMLSYFLPPPFDMTDGMWRMMGISAVIIVLWLTEAIPMAITSLLPLVLLPLFGIISASEIPAHYATPIIFLLLGSFMFGASLERWNLHKRFSLLMLRRFGGSCGGIVWSFLLGAAIISMWISNGATALMLTPIAMAFATPLIQPTSNSNTDSEVIHREKVRLAKSILYAVALGSSIGGLATIIGTPPNAFMVSVLEQHYHTHLTFFRWMAVGVPIMILLLIVSWLLLQKIFFTTKHLQLTHIQSMSDAELKSMGPMQSGEKRTLIVFGVTILLWIVCGFLPKQAIRYFNETSVAILGGVFLYIIPSGVEKGKRLLGWECSKDLPWGVLMLVGCAITLAIGFEVTGLTSYLRAIFHHFAHVNAFLLIGLLTFLSIFLTQFMANMAVATFLIPIAASLALVVHVPVLEAMLPAVIGVSLSFTLPAGTPPNAIIYAEKLLSQGDMMRVGSILALLGWLIVTGICHLLLL